MCCNQHSYAMLSGHHGKGNHACQCGQGQHFARRFQTREEKVAQLNTYLSDLQAEITAVNEQIDLLQAD